MLYEVITIAEGGDNELAALLLHYFIARFNPENVARGKKIV